MPERELRRVGEEAGQLVAPLCGALHVRELRLADRAPESLKAGDLCVAEREVAAVVEDQVRTAEHEFESRIRHRRSGGVFVRLRRQRVWPGERRGDEQYGEHPRP